MDPRCRICQTPALASVIADSLRAGSRPVDIWREEIEPRGFSSSSYYRHLKHTRRDDFMLRWTDDRQTLGESVADTFRLARVVSNEAQSAFKNHKPDLGARLAATASRLKNDAARAGFADDEVAHEIERGERSTAMLMHFVHRGPVDAARAFAESVEAMGRKRDADQFRNIIISRTNKEHTP